MEHLLFNPLEPCETVSACRESILKTDWQGFQGLMDFVPLRTPWLGFDHDAMPLCSFAEYPNLAGFSGSSLWNASFRDAHSSFQALSDAEVGRQVVALFQAWLYYGLLESIVGKKIQTSYLMRRDHDGKEYLFSRNLHSCLQVRVFTIRVYPEKKEQANIDIQLDLRHLHRWISRFTVWSHPSFRPKLDRDYPNCMNQLEEIVPAIVRLGEAIEQMRQYSLVDYLRLEYMKLHYPYKVVDLRRSRLQHLGWCPLQINLLENTVNQSTIDWLAACDIRQDPVGHETCSVEACARNNIDESTYQQAHVCHSGQCEKLIPDVQKVVAILKDDDIPIMRLERANEKLRLTVSAASKTKPGNYIAISHVWADGLGGSSERGLNLCQVERLSQLSSSYRKTSNNLWFWVDSLCIPRVQKDVYYKALVGIRDVYINASTVLVLDKIIERCTLSSSTEYLYAHIYLSAWMQRMWTYEEAVLAQQVVFVLKDGFHVYRVDTPPSMRATVCVIWQCLATQLYRLRVEKSQLNIGHIYHAFRYRLTNAPQEEFLSVSGMLGLDTQSLLELKGEERTQRFWLMLRWIPFNVPFLDCPKLSNPGFRWAPKTLMYPSPTQLDTNVESEQFECTAHGLKGTYLTIFLDQLLKGGAIDERLIRPSKIPRMGDTTNIFYIWVNGSNASITAPGDHRALLRLYCNESWPRPPEFRFFNALILPSREYRRTVIEKGQWVAGAALYHEAGVPGESPSLQSDENPIETCRFEGRLLIERLQNHEFSSGAGTFTFEGSSKIVINAQGIWSIREVCIT